MQTIKKGRHLDFQTPPFLPLVTTSDSDGSAGVGAIRNVQPSGARSPIHVSHRHTSTNAEKTMYANIRTPQSASAINDVGVDPSVLG
jgi:hypothetical protein